MISNCVKKWLLCVICISIILNMLFYSMGVFFLYVFFFNSACSDHNLAISNWNTEHSSWQTGINVQWLNVLNMFYINFLVVVIVLFCIRVIRCYNKIHIIEMKNMNITFHSYINVVWNISEQKQWNQKFFFGNSMHSKKKEIHSIFQRKKK